MIRGQEGLQAQQALRDLKAIRAPRGLKDPKAPRGLKGIKEILQQIHGGFAKTI